MAQRALAGRVSRATRHACRGGAGRHPPVRLAVAWVLAQAAVTSAVRGASRAEQLTEVLNATETPIEPDVMAQLNELSHEFRIGDASR